MMINEVMADAKGRMEKSIESLDKHFARIRTGRAHPSILDQIQVDYYGQMSPISGVANVTVEDARTLKITPWEKTMVAPIEKAIMQSDIGITPTTVGVDIRLPMPALTEERRKDMIKIARSEAEQARVAIRNVRRDANGDLKTLSKDKLITDDEEKRAEAEVQKLTDQFVTQVDTLLAQKEKDLMAV